MSAKKFWLVVMMWASFGASLASSVLIPMDDKQANHLKAYGIAYFALQHGITVDWLLNYRGGSFLFANDPEIIDECTIRGVTFETVSDANTQAILREISSP